MFKGASKKGGGMCIPDRIYFDEAAKIIIIFECKAAASNDLQKATADLRLYKSKIDSHYKSVPTYKSDKSVPTYKSDKPVPTYSTDNPAPYNVFYVAYTKDAYKIYDTDFKELDFALVPKNFNIKCAADYTYTTENMEKDIHNIHNYIRDHTKLSNGDKSFFIACILIALKKESFGKIMENYTTKTYIYDLIKECLKDFEIDVSVFEFLRNDDSNLHFMNIIKMVKKIYDCNPSIDLLNKFYSEFVKYNNTDGKSLGIVLTPDHITRLMIELLEIKPDDVFLDLCAGTGSFATEALKYNPASIISVERDNKLFNLLKCNMILRGVNLNDNRIIRGDCFEHEYKATKSAINPPYGMKDKRELDFIIKQLESLPEGGLAAAIIPTSSINNIKFLNLKKYILKISTPITIINVSKNIFYPTAAINTSIILLKKQPYTDSNVLFINYENDGVVIEKHNGLIRRKEFETLYSEIVQLYRNKKESPISTLHKINYEDDWNFHNFNLNINFSIKKSDIQNKLLSLHIAEKKLLLDNTVIDYKNTIKKYYLYEIFDIYSVKRITLKTAKDNPGKIPYISASFLNNGITAMTNIKTHDKHCLTLANSGSVGACFYHSYDICATDSVFVLRPKPQFSYISNNANIMIYLAVLIEKNKVKYSFGRACRLNKIKKDFIVLQSNKDGTPIFDII